MAIEAQAGVVAVRDEPEDAMLTRNQVADRLGVSTKQVSRLIRAGKLSAYRFGPRTIRIPESSLTSFLAECRVSQ